MLKKKKVDFDPPTEEDLTKRKVYGGGSANIPPSQVTGKKGWFGDFERHSDVARKSWNERKEDRVTPESHKKKQIRRHLAGNYDKAYDEKTKDIETFEEDLDKISEGVKIENKYVKQDEQIRQKGINESLQASKAKHELEQKIRKYEEKQDDKFIREVDDEERVKEERSKLKEDFEKDVRPAKDILEDYKRLESSAEARGEEARKRKARQEQREAEKQASIEAGVKQRKINSLTKERNNSQLKLKREQMKRSDIEQQKSRKVDEYKKKVEYLKKQYPDTTSEDIDRMTKADKNAVEQLDSRIDKQDEVLRNTESKVFDLNSELEDLTGKKETGKQVPTEPVKAPVWKEIERKYQAKREEKPEVKREVKKKGDYEKAPDWFINKNQRQSRDESWNSMPDNLKERLRRKYSKVQQIEKKPPSDTPPDWFESTEKDKAWRKDLWNAQSDKQKERLITEYSKTNRDTSKKYDIRPVAVGTGNINQDMIRDARDKNKMKPAIAQKLRMGQMWNELQYAEVVYVNDYIDAVERNDPDDINTTMNDLSNNIDTNKAKYKNTGNEDFRPGLGYD
jgi:hypothetical protein